MTLIKSMYKEYYLHYLVAGLTKHTHTHCSMTLFVLLFIENCYFCNFSIIKEHEKKIYFRKKRLLLNVNMLKYKNNVADDWF